jgi:hypothetical protein
MEKLRVAVTDLPVEGLLGMDFLSANTFIVTRDGELIMKFEGREVRYSLRPEELPLNYVARPAEETVIEPMSRRMVVCNVQCPRLTRRPDLHRIRRVVTNKILWTSADVDVPSVLVESDSTVVVPVMNKGHHPITLGVKKALVALDEAQYISGPMTTQNCELEDDRGEEGESDEGETRELPDYLQELYQLAVAKIEDPQEGHLIKRLLIDYQDIFLKPGDTLQVAKVGEHQIDVGDAATTL